MATKKKDYVKVRCNKCEMLVINGVATHEHGCPDAWKTERRECKWCGSAFEPKGRYDLFCSPDCSDSYHG
jgi:hypothetical protein